MRPRLPRITAEATAARIILRPGTITLPAAQAIYAKLAEEISTGPYRSSLLGSWLRGLVLTIQAVIDTPDPDGLVASSRRLKDADELVDMACKARSDIAGFYDRSSDPHTKSAAEALEIITAWAALQEAADDALRCAPVA